jgi:antitoxin MazE
MTTKVQRWGNSQGLRLSRQILEDARISVGDEVDVLVQDGTIMIAPVRRVRGKHSLRQLVARMPKDYKAEEVDWGRPVGKETW